MFLGLRDREGVLKDLRMGGNSDKTEKNGWQKYDLFRPSQNPLTPANGLRVKGALLVVCVEEKVGIGQDHGF